MLLLHQLNYSLRFVWWFMLVNENEIVELIQFDRVAETSPERLASIVAEGIDRSSHFVEAWTNFSQELANDLEIDAAETGETTRVLLPTNAHQWTRR